MERKSARLSDEEMDRIAYAMYERGVIHGRPPMGPDSLIGKDNEESEVD